MIVDSAVALAQAGFKVFPIVPNRKEPALSGNWRTLATVDIEQIRSWWVSNPGYNIGVAPSGNYFVLDVDIKHDRNGFDKLTATKCTLPETYTVKTPTGGFHFYMVSDKRIGCRNNWLAERQERTNLDIKGNGGYVLGQGSVIDNQPYVCHKKAALAIAPTILNLLLPIQEKLSGAAAGKCIRNVTADKSIYSTLPKIIHAGTRNDTLFKFASSFLARRIPYDMAEVLIKEMCSRCEDAEVTISESEACSILQRVYSRYEPPADEVPVSRSSKISESKCAFERIDTVADAVAQLLFIQNGSRVVHTASESVVATKVADLKNQLAYVITANSKGKQVNVVDLWLKQPSRKSVFDLRFYPSDKTIFEQDGIKFLNLYKPHNLNVPDVATLDKLQIIFKHLEYIFCGEKARKVFTNWLACTVQRPASRVTWCPVLVSEREGTGKSFFFELLVKLLGQQNVKTATMRDIDGNYNSYLRGLVTHIPELKINNIDRLKSDITDKHTSINIKFVPVAQETIFTNFFATSNHIDMVNIKENERRFWIWDVDKAPKGPAYYRKLFNWLESDGVAHFYRWLLDRDIREFNEKDSPDVTNIKRHIIEMSRSPEEQILFDAYETKTAPLKSDIICYADVRIYIFTHPMIHGTRRHSSIELSINATLHRLAKRSEQVIRTWVDGRQTRLRVIRNHKKWDAASMDEVMDEYRRGLTIEVAENV